MKYLIILILISIALYGCQQSPQQKISIEEVIDMDKDDLGELPASCAADLVYDLCQEIKRLKE